MRLGNHVAGERHAVDDVAGAVAHDGPGLEDGAVLELRRIRHVGGQQECAEVAAHDLRVRDVRDRRWRAARGASFRGCRRRTSFCSARVESFGTGTQPLKLPPNWL